MCQCRNGPGLMTHIAKASAIANQLASSGLPAHQGWWQQTTTPRACCSCHILTDQQAGPAAPEKPVAGKIRPRFKMQSAVVTVGSRRAWLQPPGSSAGEARGTSGATAGDAQAMV